MRDAKIKAIINLDIASLSSNRLWHHAQSLSFSENGVQARFNDQTALDLDLLLVFSFGTRPILTILHDIRFTLLRLAQLASNRQLLSRIVRQASNLYSVMIGFTVLVMIAV